MSDQCVLDVVRKGEVAIGFQLQAHPSWRSDGLLETISRAFIRGTATVKVEGGGLVINYPDNGNRLLDFRASLTEPEQVEISELLRDKEKMWQWSTGGLYGAGFRYTVRTCPSTW